VELLVERVWAQALAIVLRVTPLTIAGCGRAGASISTLVMAAKRVVLMLKLRFTMIDL
jgi:hypothetical protein